MKAVILIGILILSVFILGCAKNEIVNNPNLISTQKTEQKTSGAGLPTEAKVEIYNSGFTPQEVTIAKGGKVTWTNYDSADHTITGRTFPMPTSTSPRTSTRLTTGQSWEKVFDETGFFPYTDLYDNKFQGKVIVK